MVDDRTQAEVVVEIKGRAYEAGHAYVLQGRVTILDLVSDAKIIGQGGLGDQVFNIWRTAANDLASRVQTFCEETFPEVEKARAAGVKPAVLAATDRGDELTRGDADAAIAGFGDVIRLKPDEGPAYTQRGIAHVKANIRGLARADFDKAIALAPNDPLAYLHRGTVLAEGDAPAEAIPDLSAVIKMQPANADAWFQRG